MSEENSLNPFFRRLHEFSAVRWTGRVIKSIDYLIESDGPFSSVGEGCAILTSDGRTLDG